MRNQNLTGGDQLEEYMKSYDYNWNVNREVFSESPCPCERTSWIAAEYCINGIVWGKEQMDGKGTPRTRACWACHVLHAGSKALGDGHASIPSAVSNAVCAETASVTGSIFEYWFVSIL